MKADVLVVAGAEQSADQRAPRPGTRPARDLGAHRPGPELDRLADEHQPRSRTAPFATAWQQDQLGAEDLTEIVRRWRHQD